MSGDSQENGQTNEDENVEKTEREKQRRTSRDKIKSGLCEEPSETITSVKVDGEATKGKLLLSTNLWLFNCCSLLTTNHFKHFSCPSSFGQVYLSSVVITGIIAIFNLAPLILLISSSSFPQLPPATVWCVALSVSRSLVCL